MDKSQDGGQKHAASEALENDRTGKKIKQWSWVGDKLGRKKGVWISSLCCMLGATLMAASQNSNMFIRARIIVGDRHWLHQRDYPALGVGTVPNTQPRLHILARLRGKLCGHYHCLLAQLWSSKQGDQIQMEVPACIYDFLVASTAR